MKNARNARKAIVILSDGGDNRSRLTRGQIKSALVESDVQMYAMGIFDSDDLAKHTAEEKNGPRLLDDLAAQTGGRVYPVDNWMIWSRSVAPSATRFATSTSWDTF